MERLQRPLTPHHVNISICIYSCREPVIFLKKSIEKHALSDADAILNAKLKTPDKRRKLRTLDSHKVVQKDVHGEFIRGFTFNVARDLQKRPSALFLFRQNYYFALDDIS